MGGIGDLFGGIAGSIVQRREADKAQGLAQENAALQRDMAQNMDWEPEYASEHIGPYKRTESPVATAYLESFLTGTNQDGIQGTRAGANVKKADAQNGFNKQYGGWDALTARARELEKETPWAVTPIDRKASQDPNARPGLVKLGLTEEEAKRAEKFYEKQGVKINRDTGHVSGYGGIGTMTNFDAAKWRT